jgi:hypothetical protein
VEQHLTGVVSLLTCWGSPNIDSNPTDLSPVEDRRWAASLRSRRSFQMLMWAACTAAGGLRVQGPPGPREPVRDLLSAPPGTQIPNARIKEGKMSWISLDHHSSGMRDDPCRAPLVGVRRRRDEQRGVHHANASSPRRTIMSDTLTPTDDHVVGVVAVLTRAPSVIQAVHASGCAYGETRSDTSTPTDDHVVGLLLSWRFTAGSVRQAPDATWLDQELSPS